MFAARERRAAPLAAGDCLGRYQLLYPVARGGMGFVWCARLRNTTGPVERRFALKVLLPQLAEDKKFRTMLLREGRIARRIVHPNVARVVDIGESPYGVYLVIEWIDGASLLGLRRVMASRCGRRRYGLALRILADACLGLHAAHELRDQRGKRLEVVHRDISPHNILISTAGTAKLIDFGIAKACASIQADASLDGVKGKLRYMAPEQAASGRIDRRADIWSMGATLQYVVTGRSPYGRETDAGIYQALVHGARREPMPKSVPLPIREIVDRALQRDPAARFPTALEMKAALEDAADALDERATTAEVAAQCAAHLSDRVRARAWARELGRGDWSQEDEASDVSSTGGSSSWIDVSRTKRYGETTEAPEVAEPRRSPSHANVPRMARRFAVIALVGLAWALMDSAVASSPPRATQLVLESSVLPAPIATAAPEAVERAPQGGETAASAEPAPVRRPPPSPRRHGTREHRH
jgi:serine/threonine-protein kinase